MAYIVSAYKWIKNTKNDKEDNRTFPSMRTICLSLTCLDLYKSWPYVIREYILLWDSCGSGISIKTSIQINNQYIHILQLELNTVGQSKVPEQLGHDKTRGSQPWYLQYWHEPIVYLIFSEKFMYLIKWHQNNLRSRIRSTQLSIRGNLYQIIKWILN